MDVSVKDVFGNRSLCWISLFYNLILLIWVKETYKRCKSICKECNLIITLITFNKKCIKKQLYSNKKKLTKSSKRVDYYIVNSCKISYYIISSNLISSAH